MRRLLVSAVVVLAFPGAAFAQEYDANCTTADPPPVTKPAHPIHFGITPRAAGSVGGSQAQVAPEDEGKALAALNELRPPGRALVMRLNRLFWADGDEGIRTFAGYVDQYGAAGFEVESQVRYHPPPGKEGDIPAWEEYVRAVVRELGKRPALTALSITNEANFSGSQNTSDGAYEGVVDALVRGTVVARAELDAMGRPDVRLGFSMMWRWSPDSDRKFWEDIGARADATPGFREAVDYVGLQIYPGLVWPPSPRPGVTAGAEVIEALTLLRRCYMPKAKLGDAVDVWISENGYATNLGRTEETQVRDLESTLRDVHNWSGELGISDYRYFNLRDNNSDGTDLFAAVGLLRDDYSRKPAFDTFRALLGEVGTEARPLGGAGPSGGDGAGGSPPPGPPRRPARPRGLVVKILRLSRGRLWVSGRVHGARRCRGAVRIRAGRKVRRARLRPDCRFVRRIRVKQRRVRVVVRRGRMVVRRRA
ncbi:MAG TPA: hypothetical protein VF587_01250 [Solirubrobacteraceae bacterium]